MPPFGGPASRVRTDEEILFRLAIFSRKTRLRLR